jgi:RNA polymerase sigma factor (sigma-70 family)
MQCFRAERRAAPEPARLAMCLAVKPLSIAVPSGDRPGPPAFSRMGLGEGLQFFEDNDQITDDSGKKIHASSVVPVSMPDKLSELRQEIAALLPRLRRFGRTLAHSREDADDLVQVAIEKALTRTDQWTPGTRLDSWMFRIMQNAWIDELRARERRGQTFLPEEEGEHVGDGAATGSQLDAILVRKAVAKLSDEHRTIVGLVLVEGLSYQEAAETLGLPVGTVTSRLARAREALQELLGEWP